MQHQSFMRRCRDAQPVVRRRNSTLTIRIAAVAGTATLATLAFACNTDAPQAPVQRIASRDFSFAERSLTAAQQQRLEVAKAHASWAGDAHDAAMDVVIEDIGRLKKARRPIPRAGSVAHCRLLERAGLTALDVVDRKRGVKRSRQHGIAEVRRSKELANCRDEMSVFTATIPSNPFGAALSQSEPEVTGVYEYYLDPLVNAVGGSDGSVRSVQTRLNAVLAQAVVDNVPEGDLLALAGFADVMLSSSIEWNAYDWSSSGGEVCDPRTGGCDQMSVFGDNVGVKILKVTLVDALGCASTVKGWRALKLLFGGPASVALAGECGIRAAIASAGAIIGMM